MLGSPSGLTGTFVFLSASDRARWAASSLARCSLGAPSGVRAADINGDGKADVIVGYGSNDGIALAFSLGSRDGLLAPEVVSAEERLNTLPDHADDRVSFQLEIGDLNGDGRSDVLFLYHGHHGRHIRAFFGQDCAKPNYGWLPATGVVQNGGTGSSRRRCTAAPISRPRRN